MAIEFYQRAAADLVRDDAGRLTAEQVDAAIAAAVARYSGEAPRTATEEMTGASGQWLEPTGWADGASRLVSIEYPVGEVPPALLADNAAHVIAQPDGTEKIGLVDALPAASTVRVRYTTPHEVSGQADTIGAERRWGIALLAASILCGQLASLYANQSDSTISADAVEHKSKSELYAGRERAYLKQAEAALGVTLAALPAAGAGEAAGTVVSFAPRRGTRIERGLRMW